MRIPDPLITLVEQGVIVDVVRPLMSGKEAQVYLVETRDELCVAKIYKEANNRSFKNRADYMEGRRTRNTRDQRAMTKRTHYGRAQQEDSWKNAEVEAIYKLRDVGVRVPEPKAYIDGVLVMELVVDRNGDPAPRLADAPLRGDDAQEIFDLLIGEVTKMLCASVVHGDLSEFNILASANGPVIIDFPQALDASTNQNAQRILTRDVKNITRFLGRYRQGLRSTRYAEEMWDLYERGELTPTSVLTGKAPKKKKDVAVMSLLEELEEIERESRQRREALGLPPVRPARQPRPIVEEEPAQKSSDDKTSSADPSSGERPKSRRRRRRRKSGTAPAGQTPTQGGSDRRPQPAPGSQSERPSGDAPRPRRRRRRRRPGSGGGDGGGSSS